MLSDASTEARAGILPGPAPVSVRSRALLEKRQDITKDGPAYSKPFIAYTARRVLEAACGKCQACLAYGGKSSPHACETAIATIAARFRMKPSQILRLAARAGRSDNLRWPEWRRITGPYDTRACANRLGEFQAWEAERSDGIELRQLGELVAAVPSRVDAAIERDRDQAMLMYRTAAELAEAAAAMLTAAAAKLRSLDERTRGNP